MQDIEDYDDTIQSLIKKIEKYLKSSKSQNEADKLGILTSLKSAIKKLKTNLKYFSIELFKIPKQREAEFKQKHTEYNEKLKNFENQVKRLELMVKGDEVGLLALN